MRPAKAITLQRDAVRRTVGRRGDLEARQLRLLPGEHGGFGGAIGRRRAGVPTRDHKSNQGGADARDHQSRDLRLIA
jgi:hypothetical protein